MNEVLKVLKERRSCRSYRPEQITDEELNAVLEMILFLPLLPFAETVLPALVKIIVGVLSRPLL